MEFLSSRINYLAKTTIRNMEQLLYKDQSEESGGESSRPHLGRKTGSQSCKNLAKLNEPQYYKFRKHFIQKSLKDKNVLRSISQQIPREEPEPHLDFMHPVSKPQKLNSNFLGENKSKFLDKINGKKIP
jgi:hypothetical protein